MALRKSTQAANREPALDCDDAYSSITVMAEYIVQSNLANGDIIEMLALPMGTVPMSCVLASQDIDSANAVTADVGFMSGKYLYNANDDGSQRTCGAEFFSGTAVLATGGMAVSAAAAPLLSAPVMQLDRSIGIKITGAITPLVGSKIRLFVTAKQVPPGIAFA